MFLYSFMIIKYASLSRGILASIPRTVQTWKILDTHRKRNERTGISRPSYRLPFLPLPFSFSLPSSSPSTANGQVVACGFSSRGRNARSMHLESRIDRLWAWCLSRIALIRIMVNSQQGSLIFGDFRADSSLCRNIFFNDDLRTRLIYKSWLNYFSFLRSKINY